MPTLKSLLKYEFIDNYYRYQNLKHKALSAFISDAAGIASSLAVSDILDQYVSVRSCKNLWGIFSKKEIISESSYVIISYGAKFVAALLVFMLVRHIMNKLQRYSAN